MNHQSPKIECELEKKNGVFILNRIDFHTSLDVDIKTVRFFVVANHAIKKNGKSLCCAISGF